MIRWPPLVGRSIIQGLGAVALLALSLNASALPADEAYRAAQSRARALRADPARRQYRHHWLNAAHRFEQVAGKYRESPRAPESLLAAGELLEELSHLSGRSEDLDRSAADLQKLIDGYPKHPASAVALLRLGRIHLKRPVQGRRGATAAESRTRELLEAIARASAGDDASPPESGEHRPEERASAVGNLQPADALDSAKRTPAETAEPQLPSRAAAPAPTMGSPGAGMSGGPRRPGASLAQQLGLKIHRVVLDPGHGGHDTGAIGRKGTKEKDVALAIALRVRDRLSRAGLEVILTRRGDAFIALEDRARIANDARGDLFISIHCNSAPARKLRGIETYTLNTSSDRYSIRLAARENASSDRAVSDLQYILADLATKANTEESSRLAAHVQQSLVGQLRVKQRPVVDLGTKEALFYVLLGVRMPAILVETSFLSHPEEERLLSSKAYQAELAAAIASGVQDFLASRQRLAKVD